MSIDWTAEQAIGYLGTWSGFQRYLDRYGEAEIGQVLERLEEDWGDRQRVYWPINLRWGRYSGAGE